MARRISATVLSCHWSQGWARVRVTARVRAEWMKEPTTPGTLRLEQACQGHSGRATTLLLPYLSNLDHHGLWDHQPQQQDAIHLPVRLEMAREPRASGTLWLEFKYQKDHGKATSTFTLGACIGKGTWATALSLANPQWENPYNCEMKWTQWNGMEGKGSALNCTKYFHWVDLILEFLGFSNFI